MGCSIGCVCVCVGEGAGCVCMCGWGGRKGGRGRKQTISQLSVLTTKLLPLAWPCERCSKRMQPKAHGIQHHFELPEVPTLKCFFSVASLTFVHILPHLSIILPRNTKQLNFFKTCHIYNCGSWYYRWRHTVNTDATSDVYKMFLPYEHGMF